MKTILLFIILCTIYTNYSIGQEYYENIKTDKTHSSYYTILRVHYIHKQGIIENRLSADIGSDKSHPLYNKLLASKDRIVLTLNGVSKTYSNEIELLHALSKLGWTIVSVNVVTIINTQYMQYMLIH